MAKSATMSGKTKKRKEKGRYLPLVRLPGDLQRGQHLVLSLNSDGTVAKTAKVESVRRGEGCRNYHINGSGCYHRHIPLAISVAEAELATFNESDGDFFARVERLVDTMVEESA